MLLWFFVSAIRSDEEYEYTQSSYYPPGQYDQYQNESVISEKVSYNPLFLIFKTLIVGGTKTYLKFMEGESTFQDLYNTFLSKDGLIDNKADEIYGQIKEIAEVIKSSETIRDLIKLIPDADDFINELEKIFQNSESLISTYRKIVDDIINDIKKEIPYIEDVKSVLEKNYTKMAIEFIQSKVQYVASVIPEELREILNDNKAANEIIAKISEALNEISEHAIKLNKDEIADLFKFLYRLKPLTSIESWKQIIEAYGLQNSCEKLFALFEKYSYSSNLTIPFHEFLGDFSEPLSKLFKDGASIIKIIDTAATNLEKDERFKTITDIISKLIEIKDTKAKDIKEVYDNVLNKFDQVIVTAYSIAEPYKPEIQKCFSFLVDTLHLISNYLINNSFSIFTIEGQYKEFKQNYQKFYDELQFAKLDLSSLEDSFNEVKGALFEVYNKERVAQLIETIKNLGSNAYQTHYSFIKSTGEQIFNDFQTLYNTILTKVQSIDILKIIIDFFDVKEASGMNYKAFLSAAIEGLAEIENNWDKYSRLLPNIIPDEMRPKVREIINEMVAAEKFGVNVTDLITKYITKDDTTTQNLINILNATIFNQSATITDYYNYLDNLFGIKDLINNYRTKLLEQVLNLIIDNKVYIEKAKQMYMMFEGKFEVVKTLAEKFKNFRITDSIKILDLCSTILERAGHKQEEITKIIETVKQYALMVKPVFDNTIDISEYEFLNGVKDNVNEIEKLIINYLGMYSLINGKIETFQYLINKETTNAVKQRINNIIDSAANLIQSTSLYVSDVYNSINDLILKMNDLVNCVNSEILKRILDIIEYQNEFMIPSIPELPQRELPKQLFIMKFADLKNFGEFIEACQLGITMEEINSVIDNYRSQVFGFIEMINETVLNYIPYSFSFSIPNYLTNINIFIETSSRVIKENLDKNAKEILNKVLNEIFNIVEILISEENSLDMVFNIFNTTREQVYEIIPTIMHYFNEYAVKVIERIYPQAINYTTKINEIVGKARDALSESKSIRKFIIDFAFNGEETNLTVFCLDKIMLLIDNHFQSYEPILLKFFKVFTIINDEVNSQAHQSDIKDYQDITICIERLINPIVPIFKDNIERIINKTIAEDFSISQVFKKYIQIINNYIDEILPKNIDATYTSIDTIRGIASRFIPKFDISLNDVDVIINDKTGNIINNVVTVIRGKKENINEIFMRIENQFEQINFHSIANQFLDNQYILINTSIYNLANLNTFNFFTIYDSIIFGDKIKQLTGRRILEDIGIVKQISEQIKACVDKINDNSIEIKDLIPENYIEQADQITNSIISPINNYINKSVDIISQGVSYANQYSTIMTGYNLTSTLDHVANIASEEEINEFYSTIQGKSGELIETLRQTQFVKENIEPSLEVLDSYSKMGIIEAYGKATNSSTQTLVTSSNIMFNKVMTGEVIQLDEIANVIEAVVTPIKPKPSPVNPSPNPESPIPESPIPISPNPETPIQPNYPPTSEAEQPNEKSTSEILGMKQSTFIVVIAACSVGVIIVVCAIVFLLRRNNNNDQSECDDSVLSDRTNALI